MWARLLVVGDILFNLKKIDGDADDPTFSEDVVSKAVDGTVFLIEVEYRLRGEATILTYYFDCEDDRDAYFKEIDENHLKGVLLKELE